MSNKSNNILSYGHESGGNPEAQVKAMRQLVVDRGVMDGLSAWTAWEQQQKMRAQELEDQRRQAAAQVAIGNSPVQYVGEFPTKQLGINVAAVEQPAPMPVLQPNTEFAA